MRLTDTIAFLNFGYKEGASAENVEIDICIHNKLEQLRRSLPRKDFGLWCPVQLYAAVLSGHNGSLDGKDILEVGCGRGGGAAVVHAFCKPSSYTGIDLSPEGVAQSQRLFKNRINVLFQVGNSMDLPSTFNTGSFDVVLNVESSHCYPSFLTFAQGVHYSLRKGGQFLYADIIPAREWDNIRDNLRKAGLKIVKDHNITPNVLQSMHDEVAPALHKMNMSSSRNFIERPIMWLVSRQTVRAPMNLMESGVAQYRLIAAVKE